MKWNKWLENWNMTSLKINVKFLEMEFKPSEPDKEAAWEMYIELLTRIATQPLKESEGAEESALESVYSLFPTTRSIIKDHGRDCIEFTKLAVVVLNQKIRPFTAKWHKALTEKALGKLAVRKQFRAELQQLQSVLQIYTGMLAQMAGVEDLTKLEG